jgi:hypothetical protein
VIIYLIVIVFLYAALSLQGFPNFAGDPGVGWHLKNGQFIAQNGVPTTDPFLSVARPWISDQWLSDLILSFIQSNLGWSWSYLILTAIFVSCFAVILFNASMNFDSSDDKMTHNTALGISLALIVCSRVAMLHFIFRPVIFSFFLFSLTFYFILKFLNQQNIHKLQFVILFLLFCLWANIHPSFILGLILIGLSIVTVLVGKFFISKGDLPGSDLLVYPSRFTTQLLLLLFICSLATFLNPYGIELHKSIVQLGASDYFMKLNNEWLPLSVTSSEGQVTSFIVLSIIFGFLIKAQLSSRVVFSLFATLFFLYQGLVSIRFLPYFAIVSFPLLSVAYSNLHRKFFPVATTSFCGAESKIYYYFFAVLFIVLLTTSKLVGNRSDNLGMPSMRAAVEAIYQASGVNNNIIYNHPNYGGRLIYDCGQICKPVLDDRNTMLGEQAYKEYLNMKTWDDARAMLAKHNAKFLLLRDKLKLIGANSLNEIYSDDDYKIYVLK